MNEKRTGKTVQVPPEDDYENPVTLMNMDFAGVDLSYNVKAGGTLDDVTRQGPDDQDKPEGLDRHKKDDG